MPWPGRFVPEKEFQTGERHRPEQANGRSRRRIVSGFCRNLGLARSVR
jgi:hypothetical protein